MANWATSVLLASQHRLLGRMTEAEQRMKATPTLTALLKNQNFLNPAISAIQQSDQRTNSTYLLDKSSHTVSNARAYNHTGSKGTTTKVDLSWTTYAADFTISLKNASRNVFEWQEMFDNEVKGTFIDIHEEIESDALTWLNTYRSQVITPSTSQVLTWDSTNYIGKVASEDEDYFVQIAKAFMWENKYKGQFDMICDPGLYVKLERALAQGQGNSENLGFQFNNVNIYPSNGAVATAVDGVDDMAFIFPTGMIGALTWIPDLNRVGRETKAYSYQSMPDLFGSLGEFAVHQYESGADNSSNGAETQDVDQEWEFSIDVAKYYAPISTSDEYPIFKLGRATT